MSSFTFDRIDDAIDDIRQGKIVIVCDDEDRENEGDFLMAADKVTPEAINLMATWGRGCQSLRTLRALAYRCAWPGRQV